MKRPSRHRKLDGLALGLAEQFYKRLSELAEDGSMSKMVLADFYVATGELDKGIETCQAIIKAEPDSVIARKRVADIYLKQHSLEKAEALADEILEIDDQDADAGIIKGRVLIGRGRPTEAIAELQSV